MPRATLKPREERRLLRGHAWAYRSEFQHLPQVEDGEVVTVAAANGRPIGHGFYQAEGGIAVRMLSRGGADFDPAMLAGRIQDARAFRERLFPGATAWRWLHGESDGMPGCVADRYGPVVVAQSPCAFYMRHVDRLAEAFLAADGVDGVRVTVRGETRAFGAVPDTVEVELEGTALEVDLVGGQKTGLFLDQRLNARVLDTFAPGADVFDGHCYHGFWSIRAARAGARSVTGADSSAPAVDRARANARRNDVADRCRFMALDVAEALGAGDSYDVVLLDPPALVPHRAALTKGLAVYLALNRAAIRALRPGGCLVTSSCSHPVDEAAFLEMLKRAVRAERRDAWTLGVHGASPDHPVLLAMPETAYLTCAVLRVF